MSPLEALAWLGVAAIAVTVLLVVWMVVAAMQLAVKDSRARRDVETLYDGRADD